MLNRNQYTISVQCTNENEFIDNAKYNETLIMKNLPIIHNNSNGK